MTLAITDNPDEPGQYGMNLEFSAMPTEALSEGFNRHGVRENEDGSIDVRFNAMEPGERKSVEITPEFLRNTTQYEYNKIPVQLDHSDSQRANVGYADPSQLQFDGEFLQVQVHVPNTGSSIRSDMISDFTHDPPQVQDISVAFDPRTIEVERGKRGDPVKFVDGRIREFSLTPFPAGYDNGGLTPEFSAAVEQTVIDADASTAPEEAQSQLVSRPHILIRK